MTNANQQLCNDVSNSFTAACELMAKSGQKLASRNSEALKTITAQSASIAGTLGGNVQNPLGTVSSQLAATSALWLQGVEYWKGVFEDVQSTMTEATKLAQNTSADIQVHIVGGCNAGVETWKRRAMGLRAKHNSDHGLLDHMQSTES